MADGLDLLEQSRKAKTARRARVVPPPHHPKAVVDIRETTPIETPEPAPPAVGEGATDGSSNHDGSTVADPPLPKAASHQGHKRPTLPASSGDLEKLQFYVDDLVKNYLHEVRKVVVNRNDRKLDVSASAVIRLAVRHLAEEMTPDQVVDLLGSRTTTDKPGRKRR